MVITEKSGPRRCGPAQRQLTEFLPAADSLWWLIVVAAGFTGAQLLFVSRLPGLSWDEVVYVSQVSAHAPAAYFDPARARGIPLLVAPVAQLTSSVTALRVYLSVASGLGLFLALLAWRRLRPTWVLALAGVMFGGLWVTQFYGSQAMPDEWVAFSGLAAVGLFLRAVTRPALPTRESAPLADLPPAGAWPADARSPNKRPADSHPADRHQASAQAADGQAADGRAASSQAASVRTAEARAARPWGVLAGLTASIALAALVRPGDAVFLTAALMAAALAVRPWRSWPLLAATVIGFAAGSAEWAAEAYLRFGGPLARLHAAGAEQGGFGLHFGVWDELRALNGPTLCRPCTIGLRNPEISLWWLTLPVLVPLGVLAARRAGRLGSSLLPAVCGLWVAVPYLVLINYAAPRFLLPAYALLAVPVADALAWLLTAVRSDLRQLTVPMVVICLAGQLLAQHLVLDHEAAGTAALHQDYTRIAADLNHLGIRPPCLIEGSQHIPIAFYAGCASAPNVASWRRSASGRRIAVLEFPRDRPPGYARTWQRHRLPGNRFLRLVGYLAPG